VLSSALGARRVVYSPPTVLQVLLALFGLHRMALPAGEFFDVEGDQQSDCLVHEALGWDGDWGEILACLSLYRRWLGSMEFGEEAYRVRPRYVSAISRSGIGIRHLCSCQFTEVAVAR
jgi:hypothetical protein